MHKKGRPFGETSYSGKKMMTAYTRPSGGTKMSLRVSGKKETSNGRSLLKGMAKRTRGAWGSTGI
jgi:hypothetical protein